MCIPKQHAVREILCSRIKLPTSRFFNGTNSDPQPASQPASGPFGNHVIIWGSFYRHWFTLIPVWISIYIHCKVCEENTYPFPNVNGPVIRIWEWISDFISHLACDHLSILGGSLFMDVVRNNGGQRNLNEDIYSTVSADGLVLYCWTIYSSVDQI